MKLYIKIIIVVIYTAIVIVLTMFIGCQTADKNLTGKNLACNEITEKNAMPCCMMFMSSGTGSDSKDSVCRVIVDEIAKKFSENRAQSKYLFCGGKIPESIIEKRVESIKEPDIKENKKKIEKLILLEKFQSCWDKLNTK